MTRSSIASRTVGQKGYGLGMKARLRLPAEPAYEELVELVRDLPRGRTGQIIQGKLHVSGPGGPAHTHTLGELSATLLAGSPLGDPPPAGWTFLTDVELAFPRESLLVADIAGWRAPRNRIAALPAPIGLVPHWICEVLDPTTRALDLTHKRRAYALAGVENLWVVDPMARVLEVFDNASGRWVLSLAVSEDEVAAPPFKRLRFDVNDLWLPRPPRASQAPPPLSQKRRKVATASAAMGGSRRAP
jgi:Uma2 family endonuclease